MSEPMWFIDERGEKFYYEESVHELQARIAKLEADLRQMKEAIYWALGERDDFPPEPEPLAGKYRQRYWWRTELRKRSGLPIGGSPAETNCDQGQTRRTESPGEKS
jgi:hypothetical protein